jgi:hypothetical protein
MRFSCKPIVSSLAVLTLACLASYGRAAVAAEPAPPPKAEAEHPEKPPAAVIDASAYPDLQAAFDAIPESGGLVKLPPGDFRLTAPLVLSRGNTRVEGAGAATCLINQNEEGQPALIVRPPDLDENPRASLWRVQLADFRIQGDPAAVDAKSTKPKSGDGLFARNINEIYIHGLSVDHNGGHGITLDHCTEDARVCDSIITYNAQAGLNILGGHDVVVNANQFEENGDAVRCIDSFNLCMNGNNLDDHLGNGVVIENTYGSVLSGNMIEECQGTAVILDRDCYGITISANVLADNFGGGVDLRDAWGCAVSANTFTIDAVRALVIGPASGRITVTGNNFSDSFVGETSRREGKPNLATGIILQGTADVVISGNLFSGLDQHAVKADADCRRISVTGNLVMEVHQGSGQRLPPIDLGGADESICEQNIIKERQFAKKEKAAEAKSAK